MSLDENHSRSEVIGKYRVHERDTGSPEVQIALLTQRIENLSGHFARHQSDTHSRQGLFQMISNRKRLLAYLRREDVERYRTTIAALGLRK